MSESTMNLIFDKIGINCFCVYNGERYLGDVVFGIDCGWVYDGMDSYGYFTSPFLRAVADKLDELNAELFKEMPATQGHSTC